ncbi:MAG: DNA-binding transcriptional regulator [Pirellula sp.]|nr:DNA-binding transcriptional regulator [Pirellula sp.]
MHKCSSSSRRQVVLLIETSSAYGRGLLAGIVRFMRMHDEWSVFLEQRDLTAEPPAWLESWQGDGIVSRVTTPRLLEIVRRTQVPTVELTDRYADSGLPLVRTDDLQVGRIAADHLLERGFRNFAFCGYRNEAWSDRRLIGFRGRLREKNFDCTAHHVAWLDSSTRTWDEEQNDLAAWLRTLGRPCGILACNDACGQSILSACIRERIAVPEHIAVLGVDNDDLLCSVCDPALSSVVVNAEGVGFRAAEVLSALMAGQKMEQVETTIPPLGIAVRQSTDVVAIDDPAIVTALQYIRQNASRGITVQDVVRHTGISRSSLERKIRKHLGRTPQEEIRNVQIKRVKELLATTELSAERIAPLCGFEHPEYMYVVFKRHENLTPGEFRIQAKRG